MSKDKGYEPIDARREHELLVRLDSYLLDEREGAAGTLPSLDASAPTEELWTLFRALVNTRPPLPADPTFLSSQDELLRGRIARAGISSPEDAVSAPDDARLRLWRGDITTLSSDAIVNAANRQMLGCWVPGHHCIDNAIHTFAGVQLRIRCAELMREQGHDEPTGQAKLTPAFNLPARHVIHTVGPIADGRPTTEDERLLASCYVSCLDTALEAGDESIALCCISTGVFGFPKERAARIATDTVRSWLSSHDSQVVVVFNVFDEESECIYRSLLHL
jgi:O-acetyl-ADP-ribose deacetylase (regulator of RNase III)